MHTIIFEIHIVLFSSTKLQKSFNIQKQVQYLIIIIVDCMQNKIVKTASQVRQIYSGCQAISKHDYSSLFQQLSERGFMANPKICEGTFQLRNGLPYTGIAAKQDIQGNEILMRIPEQLILTAPKALTKFQLREVFLDNFFSQKESMEWQYRILTVYALYLDHQKDDSNVWYHMIKKFPKSCDLIYLWDEKLIASIKDKKLIKAISDYKQKFDDQLVDFAKCRQRHQILQSEQFSPEKYKWIFSNVWNRSFGKYLKNISLLPFVDHFNHHSCKVNYSLQKEKKANFVEENCNDDGESSIGSYDSVNSDEDFDQSVMDLDIGDKSKQQVKVKMTFELEQVKQVQIDIEEKLLGSEDLMNKNFALPFIALLWKETVRINEINMNDKIKDQVLSELSSLKNTIQMYFLSSKKYFKNNPHHSYYSMDQINQRTIFKNSASQTKEYESVIIKASKLDHFKANNQVYFRYGRDTNRNLLLDYGFAIEGNKYEYFSIVINLLDHLKELPNFVAKIASKELPLTTKFKIYHHILNTDIISYYRLLSWANSKENHDFFQVKDLKNEINILQRVMDHLQQHSKQYQSSCDLTDKSLNYQQYFIEVYYQEKWKILKIQITMLERLISFLRKILEGETKEVASEIFTKSELKIFKKYIELIES